jgi:uncharacterized NAD-dependent epimerase/dehydratase family protein
VSKRYLILAEGHSGDPHHGKTARGVIRYSPHPAAAVVDSERPGEELDGVPVVATVADGLAYGPTTALIGVATTGGVLPPAWRGIIADAIRAGLDVESGMHAFLADDEEYAGLARTHGVELRDLRRPPDDLGVPTGENLRHGALVVHTVGSDCAIGKKTMAIELDLEARARGLPSVFVPTGQTGILIAGWGIAVDAVVADYVAGAGERLVVEGARRGGLLWVEGQGSLIHPFYAGVTLGLYHGCMPHVLVLCHLAGETVVGGMAEHPMPSLPEVVRRYELAALPARPAKVGAIALNTSALDAQAARWSVAEAEAATGLVADDPVRFGAGRLLDAVLAALPRMPVAPR